MSTPQRVIYGPSAIATPANAITVLRICFAPVLVVMVLSSPTSIVPFWLWSGLAISDSADGYIARRQGVTRSGAFLDPLADKILVFAAFGALFIMHRIDGLPVLIMGLREVAVSVYRTQVLAAGRSLPARIPGKLKMLVQILVIGFALIPSVGRHDRSLVDLGAWIGVVLALVSAVQYFLDSKSIKA
ncbi:MAG: CDP-alcohol phosphatidyltransferase family protein [Ferrimicrobium sp.]|jgi:CDP-diacylglycerol--glycerol-3-phosphate 3-phosphatidyltransferase|uniref:CDP-alcohol phosphatidyltransferase family protein n=1 Tax=Ferrimicrobium sp. TaxID=2926050 RepID=UPI002606D359|nr:CDP-alcohol phosphatidyltransferase family protein [Ferrimicrobium sp.]MCL5973476.1 CDP-alcohol phosphatidyltransferase family protein [Actinomycetota bacterium]